MTEAATTSQTRLSSAALAIAGVLFVLYPALRPFSDETSLQGAAAFASTNWLVAHLLAIFAFTLLPVGLLGFQRFLHDTPAARRADWALVVSLIGVGLTLPFYGGEVYGLHAIGQEALRQQSAALLSVAAAVRSGVGLALFLVGLLLLAIAAILVALATWGSGRHSKWSGIPFAVGMGLYIPQFFWTQPLRVGHGLLVAIGCLWIAANLWRQSNQE